MLHNNRCIIKGCNYVAPVTILGKWHLCIKHDNELDKLYKRCYEQGLNEGKKTIKL
jgi:hypothetical protein